MPADRDVLSDHSERGAPMLPIRQPADHMLNGGVHPDISHERDVPAMVAEMVAKVDAIGHEVERAYDADKNTTWREYAKQLAARIKNQRGEIRRLHKKVRELRADVHERDERIAELAPTSDETEQPALEDWQSGTYADVGNINFPPGQDDSGSSRDSQAPDQVSAPANSPQTPDHPKETT